MLVSCFLGASGSFPGASGKAHLCLKSRAEELLGLKKQASGLKKLNGPGPASCKLELYICLVLGEARCVLVRLVVFFWVQRRLFLFLYIRSFPDAPGKLPDAPRKLPDAPANVQTYKHTNVQTYKHTNIQTYKHTSIQTYKHTNI